MIVNEARPLDELAGALAAFQAEAPVIPKKQTAKIETQGGRNYSYTYADLATMAPVVLPLLAKHGLAFTALPSAGHDGGPPLLVGMLLHTSGQYVCGELPITGKTPQEIGSSLTYGRRYLLGCLTGVVSDDDDDGQLAEKAARRPRKAASGRAGPEPVNPPVAPAIQRRERPRPVGSAPPEPDAPPRADPGQDGNAPTDQQIRALFAAIGKALGPDASRAERLALCSAIVGRALESSTELNRPEVGAILDWLEEREAGRASWVWDPEAGTGEAGRMPPPEPPDAWVAHDEAPEWP